MFELNVNEDELRDVVRSAIRDVLRAQDVGASTAAAVPKLLYSDNEAALQLGVSVRTFWRMVDENQLPLPVRVRQKTLWRAADLQAWVDAQPPYTPKKKIGSGACNGSADE